MDEVGAEVGVGAQKPEVLVEARGVGVVVARADMAVAAQRAGFLADHQRGLRVRLQTHQAVDDVHADLLQRLRPRDVRLLVEPRFELDERSDLLARLGGADERGDDRAVTGRAVQRHLDREHRRVDRRLPDELLDGGRERVVRMVHEDVAARGSPRRCSCFPRPPQRARVGVTGIHGSSFRSGRGNACTDHRPARPSGAWWNDTSSGSRSSSRQQQLEHLGRHAVVDLEPNGTTEPAAAQLHLDGGEEIVCLLLFEREVGVAGDAERHEVDDVHAGEQRREVRGDHLLERHEALTIWQ